MEALDIRCKPRNSSVEDDGRGEANRGARVRQIISKIWKKTIEEENEKQLSLKESGKVDSDDDLLPIEKDN